MDHTNKNICLPNQPPDSRRKVQCILCLSQPQDHEPASLNSMKMGSTNPQIKNRCSKLHSNLDKVKTLFNCKNQYNLSNCKIITFPGRVNIYKTFLSDSTTITK